MYLLATSYEGHEKTLYDELNSLGKFRPSGFRGVFIGEVDDFESFMEELGRRQSYSVSRIVPIDKWFKFKREDFDQKLKDSITSLLPAIKSNETYSVKVTRRGFKGILSSQEIASETGKLVGDLLERRDGMRPKVSLKDPDKAILIEIAGSWCGIGIIPKSLRVKYPYIKW